MVSFGPWTFRIQKDRSNINDYFEEGDLSCLFDESEVVDQIKYRKQKIQKSSKKEEKKSKIPITKKLHKEWGHCEGKKLRENEELVKFGPWCFRVQKDRSKINDYFEEGDLACLFDESQVLEGKEFLRSIRKRYTKKREEKKSSKKPNQKRRHRKPEVQKEMPIGENEELVKFGPWCFRI